MNDISFSCSHCGQHVSIDESAAGIQVKCPTCQGDIIIPQKSIVAPGKGRFRMLWLAGIAAAFIVLAVLGIWFFTTAKRQQPPPSRPEKKAGSTVTIPDSVTSIPPSRPEKKAGGTATPDSVGAGEPQQQSKWQSDFKYEVKMAANRVADVGNYSWRLNPKHIGKISNGIIYIQDGSLEIIRKGESGAIRDMGQWPKEWTAIAQIDQTALGGQALSVKAAVPEALDLLEKIIELKKEGGAFWGTLSEKDSRQLLGSIGESCKEPKGEVRFWIKDRLLWKYQCKLSFKLSIASQDMLFGQDRIVEITDVGSTTFDVSKEAREKL